MIQELLTAAPPAGSPRQYNKYTTLSSLHILHQGSVTPSPPPTLRGKKGAGGHLGNISGFYNMKCEMGTRQMSGHEGGGGGGGWLHTVNSSAFTPGRRDGGGGRDTGHNPRGSRSCVNETLT